MAIRVICPQCSKTLRLPEELSDRKIRCPQCRCVFAMQDAVMEAEIEASPAQRRNRLESEDDADLPGRRRVRRPTEDDDDDTPRPARRRRNQPRFNIGAMIGGLLAAVIVGGGTFGLVNGRRGANGGPNNALPAFGGPAFVPPGFVQPPGGAVPAFGQPELAAMPALPPAEQIEPGVVVHKVAWQANGIPRQVWIYLPETPAKRLPVVLIAPAGSPLVTGMDLANGDRPEHLPYVRAGFAVVAYSLDGAVPNFENLPPLAWADGVRKFMSADSGVQNARLALDYALARVPALDPARIYTAGHSSAATVSLLVAEREPRIKGCIAFAPVSDIGQKEPNAGLIRKLDTLIPGCSGYFFGAGSPNTSAATLTCPVFLFHAQDDSVVPITQSDAFAAQLRLTNQHVKYVRAKSGNHYNSMIQQGIPEAVRWLKQQAGM